MVLAALAVGLAGCSTIKFAYNNLDDVGYWWLDSYVDFDDAQSPRVRAELARLHRWHRSTELPLLGLTVRNAEQMAASDVTPAQVCALEPPLRERLLSLVDRAETAVVGVATALEPDQLQHLEKKYQRLNDSFRKDWLRLDAAALKEKRYEQLLDRSEMVYGSLEAPQRAVLRSQLERSVYDPRKVLTEKQRRQQDLLQVLRQVTAVAAAPQATEQLRGYVQRVMESPDPAYRAYERAWINENCALVAALHNSTTTAQREAAVKRLRAWQRDLRELAAKP